MGSDFYRGEFVDLNALPNEVRDDYRMEYVNLKTGQRTSFIQRDMEINELEASIRRRRKPNPPAPVILPSGYGMRPRHPGSHDYEIYRGTH